MRWALIGGGDVAAKRLFAALSQAQGSELVCLVGRDPDRTREAAESHGIAAWYTSMAEAFEREEVDAVYIATPVYLHRDQTLLAAAHGKHVLVEKPMALTCGEAEAMVEACEAAGVTLQVAYYRRFYPKLQRISELIQSGMIGKPVSVHGQFSEYFDLDPRANWRVRRALGGGGPLMDIGSHSLDLMIALFGPVRRVAAQTAALTFAYEVEDSISLLLQFASGVQATASYHFNVPATHSLVVNGTAGRILSPQVDQPELVWTDREGAEHVETLPRHKNMNIPLIENFIAAVEGRAELLVPGRAGAYTSRVVDAVYRSAQVHKWVDV